MAFGVQQAFELEARVRQANHSSFKPGVPLGARALVRSLLQVHPGLRLRAAQVMEHGWVVAPLVEWAPSTMARVALPSEICQISRGGGGGSGGSGSGGGGGEGGGGGGDDRSGGDDDGGGGFGRASSSPTATAASRPADVALRRSESFTMMSRSPSFGMGEPPRLVRPSAGAFSAFGAISPGAVSPGASSARAPRGHHDARSSPAVASECEQPLPTPPRPSATRKHAHAGGGGVHASPHSSRPHSARLPTRTATTPRAGATARAATTPRAGATPRAATTPRAGATPRAAAGASPQMARCASPFAGGFERRRTGATSPSSTPRAGCAPTLRPGASPTPGAAATPRSARPRAERAFLSSASGAPTHGGSGPRSARGCGSQRQHSASPRPPPSPPPMTASLPSPHARASRTPRSARGASCSSSQRRPWEGELPFGGGASASGAAAVTASVSATPPERESERGPSLPPQAQRSGGAVENASRLAVTRAVSSL